MFRKPKKLDKKKASFRANKKKRSAIHDDDSIRSIGNNSSSEDENNHRERRTTSAQNHEDDEGTQTTTTYQLIQEARHSAQNSSISGGGGGGGSGSSGENSRKRLRTAASQRGDDDGDHRTTLDRGDAPSSVLHQYETSKTPQLTAADLATREAQHHPKTKAMNENNNSHESQGKRGGDGVGSGSVVGKGSDGIFRNNARNKFWAGPIKASTFVRTTARFDYQPDICKDYKETGFCGFGDTCIYLHDRGDSLTGWQLEQQWEEEQKRKREQHQKEMEDFASSLGDDGDGGEKFKANKKAAAAVASEDGLPFACHLCREAFENPVITICGHYFCESCIMTHVRTSEGACPICRKDTHGVFNQPTKLLSKRRRLLGSGPTSTWEEFAKVATSRQN